MLLRKKIPKLTQEILIQYNLDIEKIHSLNLQCNSWGTYLKYGGNRRAFFLLTSILTFPWTWGQASHCLAADV